MCVCVCACVCVCVCVRRNCRFGKSDKIIKISGKVDKPTLTTDSAIIFRSLFFNAEDYEEVLF